MTLLDSEPSSPDVLKEETCEAAGMGKSESVLERFLHRMRIQKQLAWKNQDLKDLKDKDEAQRTTERNYGFDEAPSLFTQTKQAKGIHYARTWVMN